MGYVGLPLAIAFSRHFEVVGYDSDSTRIVELREGRDRTNELELASQRIDQSMISFSDELELLQGANFYCVCVPTPIDGDKKPDLGPLERACRAVASSLSAGGLLVLSWWMSGEMPTVRARQDEWALVLLCTGFIVAGLAMQSFWWLLGLPLFLFTKQGWRAVRSTLE